MTKLQFPMFAVSLLLSLFCSSTTLAQSPAQAPVAPATPISPTSPPPSPPTPASPLVPAAPSPDGGSPNLLKILKKAGPFTLFIRLLKSTGVGDQLAGEINSGKTGLTIFAPTDNAFSSLKTGFLNSLTDEQKTELMQFHVVPSYISMSQFQTVSNPLRTNAGDTSTGRFPFNVTVTGSSVNITTGLTNTSVSGTVYNNGQLAVYQVDRVLFPLDIFIPKPPAPAPEPPQKPKKKAPVASSPVSVTASEAVSVGIVDVRNVVMFGVVGMVNMFWL